MKKFTLLFLFLSLAAMAQKTFPFRQPELLIGKHIKIIALNDVQRKYDGEYRSFYSDSELKKFYKGSSGTSEPELLGKVFVVKNVEAFATNKYKYTLENAEEGTVYFSQSKDILGNIELIDIVELPANYYDSYIKTEKISDKITEIIAETGYLSYISFSKFITQNEPDSYLVNFVFDWNADSNPTGININFDNGKSFSRPTHKFEYVVKSANTFSYFTSIKLTKAELELFRNNLITNYKVVSKEINVRQEYGDLYKNLLNYLVTKK